MCSDKDIRLLNQTFHPLFLWNHVMMNYCGYVYLKKSNPYRKSFLITSTVITLQDAIFVSLSIYTLIITSFDKDISTQIGMNLAMWTATSLANTILSSVFLKLREAENLLKGGVYRYATSDIGENDIIRKTVKRIRFFLFLFQKATLFTMTLVVIIVPFLKIVFIPKEETSTSTINPYLPAPIYIPFDTNGWCGFIFAMILIGLPMLFVILCIIFHSNLVLSSTLQLCGQFDVLIFSVRNITKRAFLKLIERNVKFANLSMDDVFMMPEFHRCLYFCLRENILHHQAILR